jgi:FRG domain
MRRGRRGCSWRWAPTDTLTAQVNASACTAVNDPQTEIPKVAAEWMRSHGSQASSIECVSEFVSFVTQHFRGGDWIFRGEGRLFPAPVMPVLYRSQRDLTRRKEPSRTITDQEVAEIERCQLDYRSHAIKDSYLNAFRPDLHDHDVNWLALARHFGYVTRLVDVTRSPLVALYFACADVAFTEDAYVFALHKSRCRPICASNGTQSGRSDYPPIPINYLDLYDVDRRYWQDGLDDAPYLFSPSIPLERMSAQASHFLFWRLPGALLHKVAQLIPIRISGARKHAVLSELTALGVSRQTLLLEDPR